jgi:hypothetical protein
MTDDMDMRQKLVYTINNICKQYENEISRIEIANNLLKYKTKEIHALINEHNIYKMQQINEMENLEYNEIMKTMLSEKQSVDLLTSYLHELEIEIKNNTTELDRKRSFHESIKNYIYSNCNHMWIFDHFENPASQSMNGITYCVSCGLKSEAS